MNTQIVRFSSFLFTLATGEINLTHKLRGWLLWDWSLGRDGSIAEAYNEDREGVERRSHAYLDSRVALGCQDTFSKLRHRRRRRRLYHRSVYSIGQHE